MNKEERLLKGFRMFNLGAIIGVAFSWIVASLFFGIIWASSFGLLVYIITISFEIESKIKKVSKHKKEGIKTK